MSTELPIIDQAVLDELRASVGGDEAFVRGPRPPTWPRATGHISRPWSRRRWRAATSRRWCGRRTRSSRAAPRSAPLRLSADLHERSRRRARRPDGWARRKTWRCPSGLGDNGRCAAAHGAGRRDRLRAGRADRRRQLRQPDAAGAAPRCAGHRARARPRTARTALEALQSYGGDVAVVLLDVVMPEMDGYETLAAIKSDESLRHLPVIMISGVDELDSVARCIEMGAADYLPKPFNPVDPRRARPGVARRQAAARPRGRARRGARRRCCETIERQKDRAEPLPVAAGRGARLEPGGRAAAGRPPPRGDVRVLRPARLHRVQRHGRAGGGARRAARVPRGDGRAHRRVRRARSSTSPATA